MKPDDRMYIEIGRQLHEARTRKNWSLRDLSEALHEMKSKSTLKRYEDGTTRITMPMLDELCYALNLDRYEVMSKAQQAAFNYNVDKFLDDVQSVHKMDLDEREVNLVKLYRKLSPEMKDAIDKIIQNMSEK